jgi:hypothetical protein
MREGARVDRRRFGRTNPTRRLGGMPERFGRTNPRPFGAEYVDGARERIGGHSFAAPMRPGPRRPCGKSTGLVAIMTRTAPVGRITRRPSMHAAPPRPSWSRAADPNRHAVDLDPRWSRNSDRPGAPDRGPTGVLPALAKVLPQSPARTAVLQLGSSSSHATRPRGASRTTVTAQTDSPLVSLSATMRALFSALQITPATGAGEHLDPTYPLRDSYAQCPF